MGQLVNPIREIEKVKEIAELLQPRERLIWNIGTQIGLRVSDILALNTDIVGKSVYFVREKKTGKYKKFPISEDLQEQIEYYYENYRKKQKNFSSEDAKKALFVNRKHNRHDRATVWRHIKKACDKVGLEDNFGTHTMRKTFGYHHYRQFHDIAILQKIFNHSSAQVTLRYIGIEQEDIDKSYQKFSYDTYDDQSEIEKMLRAILSEYLSPLDKILKEKADSKEKTIEEKIKAYLKSGAQKHRDFCKLLLCKETPPNAVV